MKNSETSRSTVPLRVRVKLYEWLLSNLKYHGINTVGFGVRGDICDSEDGAPAANYAATGLYGVCTVDPATNDGLLHLEC